MPENCPDHIYNLWDGYAIEKVDALYAPHSFGGPSIEPFIKLANQLTEGNTDYLFKWLAYLLQHPGSKPITSLVFTSVQGTGKNSFFDLFGRIMGPDLYYETSDPENQLFGRFATCIEKCKLLFIDEIDASTSFKNSSRMKALITNPRHTVEKKGVQSYEVQNLCGLVFASNNPTPVKIESSDRRYVVYNPQKVLDQDFFNNWMVWVKDKHSQRAVYDYLMAIDVENIDWIGSRPINEAYKEIKYNALPSFVKWLDAMVVEDFDKKWDKQPVSSKDLYFNYKQFGHHNEKNQKAFGLELRRLIQKDGLVGLDKATPMYGCNRYEINRDKVFEWLQQKGYTLADKIEEPVEIEIVDGDY